MKYLPVISMGSMVTLLVLKCQAIPMSGWQRMLPGSSSRESKKNASKVQDCYEPPVDPDASPEHPYATARSYMDPEADWYQHCLDNLGNAQDGWQTWFHEGTGNRWTTILERCQDALLSLGQELTLAEGLLNDHGNNNIGQILLLNKVRWHKIVARHLLAKEGINV